MTHYPEPMVARVTGAGKSRLAELRHEHLEKGADWVLKNSVVCYTPAGLRELLEVAGIDAEALTWPPEAVRATATPQRSPATPQRGAAEVVAEKKNVEAPAEVAGGVAACAATEAGRPLVECQVVALTGNPAILLAADLSGARIRVRVRSNLNFVPGMKLRARMPADGRFGVYSFEGQCPRWKGHW